MNRLPGKTVLITGGAGAIGLAAAKRYVQEGAKVVLVDVSESALAEALKTIGSDHVSYVVADVTKPEDTQRYVQTVLDRHGSLDVFLANAGIEGAAKPIPEYPVEMFDRVMSVNVRGAFVGLQHVIPVLAKREGGSIVITSSIAGLKATGPGLSAYMASKHALVGLMRAAALECAPLNIRVNSIHPAPVQSRMMVALEEAASPGAPAVTRQRILATIPLARYGTPEEVAQLLLFLASDESRFCTGGVYPVDGGMSAR
jgi:NAD(P)-dependent dehydrogenase (short-subunit alcohol dehydrogenase family)